ncbi:saccharopine dehydrogenase C-terminal domain-containing protein [Pseudomonas fluorescens]|jgi:homospermidine synthase|uniref:saccharopine dehydrogenase C-terminal domain-containing protein n=1 Tax=Pseudomonas TaxID=286 RepID=UPI001A9194B6|nr:MULTISPECIES: saccharopine dehydrogenase C-terminal domain-containing protein [Pseudomonas]MDZ5433723.1 saccharopine dehydrogenase C-terminal domain-containing protein [Pseudomonas fluorescens]
MRHTDRIIIVGFGSIAQALLPLLTTNYNAEIIIFDKEIDQTRKDIAKEYSVILYRKFISEENFREILSPLLTSSSFLLNLAVSVSSTALIELAQQHKTIYLDTCIEPWEYYSQERNLLLSNHTLREHLKKQEKIHTGTTALVAHGANPGFISILLKKAMLEMAHINNINDTPTEQSEWAKLAAKLGIQVIQISERDTQMCSRSRKPDNFMCTWSVDGFITECLQPAEMGWGSHEREIPSGATLKNHSLELSDPGREVSVKSWSPNYLEFTAFLLTHNESLSIAEYLTVGDPSTPTYRPTVYYAYHPCDQALDSMKLLSNGNEDLIASREVLKDDIVSGIDELGIFLISTKYKSYWLGSNLSIGKARKMAKHNSATSLQVTSSIVAGMKWAEQNPESGVLESENLDWQFIYNFAEPYWQPIVTQETDWRPNNSCKELTFKNFRTLSQD